MSTSSRKNRIPLFSLPILLGLGALAAFAASPWLGNTLRQTQAQAPEKTEPAQAAQAPASKRVEGQDWSLFRGDPQAQGIAHTTLPEKPKLLWKYRVPKGAFESTPAIVDNVVYIGDLDGQFFALNLADGKEIWKAKAEIGFMAAPAVQDGKVYIGDIDGVFHCFDAKTGKELWKLEAQAEIDSSANFYKDNVLFGSQDATLYCVNAKSGKLVWKHEIEDQIRCSPTIVDNRCFVAGCDSKLHAINLDTGEKSSDVEIMSPTGSTPAVKGHFVYFGTEGGEVLCVDWKESKVAWRYTLKRNMAFRSSPAVTNELVVIGGRDKRLHGIDINSGEEKWTFLAKHRVDSSPVIVGKRAFFGSAAGRVHGVDIETGKEQWVYEAGGSFTGAPAIANRRLVIANDDGVVYCFGE